MVESHPKKHHYLIKLRYEDVKKEAAVASYIWDEGHRENSDLGKEISWPNNPTFRKRKKPVKHNPKPKPKQNSKK